MNHVHVYWSPHSDDETIGMAGSIARSVASGAHVCLVLVTDNRPSERGRSLFPSFSIGELMMHRRAEWWNAANALGVEDVRSLGIPEMLMYTRRDIAHEQLVGAMRWLQAEGSWTGSVTHHVVMGESDTHAETGNGTLAHRLCYEAGRAFAHWAGAPVLAHAVYTYSHPIETRRAMSTLHLTEREMDAKRRAIAAYKPGGPSIGYGYLSVPELFDGAASDPREFLEIV